MNTIIVTLKKSVKTPIIVLNKRGWLAISGADRIEYIPSEYNKNNSFILKSDKSINFVREHNKNVRNVNFDHLPCYDESIIEEMAKRGGL